MFLIVFIPDNVLRNPTRKKSHKTKRTRMFVTEHSRLVNTQLLTTIDTAVNTQINHVFTLKQRGPAD